MDSEDYVAQGTEAFHLKFLRADGEGETQSYNPEFVYPIFGEDETIYGYKKLNIELTFGASQMDQLLTIDYSAKLKNADDIEQKLYDFIPPTYSKNKNEFVEKLAEREQSFKPLGERIARYKINSKGKSRDKFTVLDDDAEEGSTGSVFEVYTSKFATPGFVDFYRRIRILSFLYIEGASALNEEDSKWEFITLFEKKGGVYYFAGYVTLYPYFFWPESTRLRLSQFIIAPPYHRQGHGSALYSIIFDHAVARESVSEFTIEDPSEAFDDLRDKNDLRRLINNRSFDDISLPLDREKTEQRRRELKIAPRQFYRLLEMYKLWAMNEDDDEKPLRLTVKKRLYLFNKNALDDLSEEEKKEKLQETYANVMEQYATIISEL